MQARAISVSCSHGQPQIRIALTNGAQQHTGESGLRHLEGMWVCLCVGGCRTQAASRAWHSHDYNQRLATLPAPLCARHTLH
jgi:hypothetical protein